MAERIKMLEVQLKDLQDEMSASSIQVGTVIFVSRSQTKAWMDLNGALRDRVYSSSMPCQCWL